MTPQQCKGLLRDPKPIIGGSLKLVAPTGNYDSDQLINVDANRWVMKAKLGLALPLRPNWLFEAAIGSWVFEDNGGFFCRAYQRVKTHRSSAGALDSNL